MSDEVKVSIELNATRATQGLARFQSDLLETDKIFAKLIKKQGEWAADYSTKLVQARQSLSSFAKAAQSYDKQRATEMQATGQKVVNDFMSRLKSTDQALKRFDQQHAESNAAAMKQRVQAADVAARVMIRNALEARTAEANRIKEMAALQQRYQKSLEANTTQFSKMKTVIQSVKAAIKDAFSTKLITDLAEKLSSFSLFDLGSRLGSFGKSAANISSEFLGYQNSLQLASGSQEKANKEMHNAIGLARALKLDIGVLMREYSKFSNSVSLAGVPISKAREIFEQFAGAARVLNLTPERTSGMFLAIEQMVSKGTVSMEELRRQLGDHLPGALNMAAEAMGYGKGRLKEFMDEVKKGNVVSTELITKLGDLVYMRTKDLVPQSLRKYSANVQALTTEWTLFKSVIGEALADYVFNPFLEALTALTRGVNKLLGPMKILGKEISYTGLFSDTAASNANKLGEAFTSVSGSVEGVVSIAQDLNHSFDLMETNSNLSVLGIALLGTTASVTTASIASLIVRLKQLLTYAFSFKVLSVSLNLVKTSFLSLGKFLFTNPFGLAITGITTLIGLYPLFSSSNDTAAKAVKQTKTELELLTEKIIAIRDNGIDEDFIISQGVVNTTKQRIENLTTELNNLDQTFWALRQKQIEVKYQGGFLGWLKDIFPDLKTGDFLEKQSLDRAAAGVKQAIEVATDLREAQINSLRNPLTSFDQVGTDLQDKVQKIYEKTSKQFKPKDPIQDAIDAYNELIDLERNNPIIIKRLGQADESIPNPNVRILEQERDKRVIKLREEKAAYEALKEAKKKITNEYANEVNALSELVIKQNENLANLYLTDDQQLTTTQGISHLNRVREYEVQLIEKKLSQNEFEALVKQSEATRDLVIETQRLTNAKNLLVENEKRAQQLVDTLDPAASIRETLDETSKLIEYFRTESPEMARELQAVLSQGHKDLAKTLEEHKRATNPVYRAWKEIGEVIKDSFADGITQGKKFKDVINDLGNTISNMLVKMAIDRAVARPMESLFNSAFDSIFKFLPSFFAQGSAFENGVQKFSKGSAFTNSVVKKPTLFKFAKGTGLMGEAGAEAIMPLTRTKSGDLGVKATGTDSKGVIVNVINNARTEPVQVNQRMENGTKIIDVIINEIKSSIASDISRGSGSIPSSLSNTYGLSRVPGAY